MEKHVFLRTMDWLSGKDIDNAEKGRCIFEGSCCFRLLDKESRILFFKTTSSNDDSTQLNMKLFIDSTKQPTNVIAILDGMIYRIDISYISRITLYPGMGSSSCTAPPYIEWLFPTVAFRYYSHNMEPKEKLIHQLKLSINELIGSRCFDDKRIEKQQGEYRQNFIKSLRAYMVGERQDLDWIATCIPIDT
jgi:hypothetical protein